MTDALDYDALDFFRGPETVADPYPYFDWLREQCPVRREPAYGVYMVTGYEEAFAVYTDPDTFSSCNSVTGPFPGFPVPLEGQEDVSGLIAEHRGELPFSDQIITMDPPEHHDHRHLLMRQLTPKRLKENEDFVWRLADRQIDELMGDDEPELMTGYANPFAMFVIADLLGVPESDHEEFRTALSRQNRGGGVGSTQSEMSHNPLEWLYERFSRYIEDRRRAPRDDVLTALASTRFPNGDLPEVIDVVRVATNVFAAGQETTVRLLGTALQLMYEYPQYTYTQSAAAYNEWMAQKYPDMNAEISSRIKEGRWEIVGGMWVEPDLNMPDGESLVRQLLVGKRWYKQAYGVDVRI